MSPTKRRVAFPKSDTMDMGDVEPRGNGSYGPRRNGGSGVNGGGGDPVRLADDGGAPSPVRLADEISKRQLANKARDVGKDHPLSFWAGLELSTRYVFSNAKKSRRSTAIGVTTVFIVVLFVGLLQNIILRSPLIFLRLAETSVGEMDMLIVPESVSFDPLLDIDTKRTVVSRFSFFNATDIQRRLEGNELVMGATPRWFLRGSLVKKEDFEQNAEPDSIVTNIMICDDVLEKQLQIGRAWPYRALGDGETHVTSSVLRSLGIRANAGDKIMLDLGMGKLLATFNLTPEFLKEMLRGSIFTDGVAVNLNGTRITEQLKQSNVFLPEGTLPERIETRVPIAQLLDVQLLIDNTIDGLVNGNLMDLELSVVDGIEFSYEKYPPIGNVVLLETKHFLNAVKRAANKIPLMQMLNIAALTNRTGSLETALLLKDTPVTDDMFGDDMNQYAFTMVVQYKHRLRAYLKDTQGTKDELAEFANSVGESLGFNSGLKLQLPVHSALEPLKYLRIFLQQIFNSVVFVTVCHGCLTVYSLLLTDTGARTYEYGMLRMMGMRQRALGQLLLVQSLFYAVPGVLLGLFASWVLSIPVLWQISQYAVIEPDYGYYPAAIATTVCLGLGMSFAGNMIPIRRALGRSLAESLDLYHKTLSETTIKQVRIEDLGLSPSQTTAALGLVFAGGLIYYVIPMSFVFRDFDLLLSSLNAILIGTVVGLVILSVLLQPSLEALVVRCIMWGDDAKLMPVVLKNMSSHRDKSRKTSLMFTSSLAFLVFAGAMFSLQAESIIGNLKVALGSDLVVDSGTGELDEARLAGLMDREMRKPAGERVVVDYAWASWPIWNIDPPVRTVYISNVMSFPKSYRAEVVAVTRNFLDVTYSEYFLPQSTDGCRGRTCVTDLDVPYSQAVRDVPRDRAHVLSRPKRCDEPGQDCSNGFGRGSSGGLQFDAIIPASLSSAIQAEIGTPLVLVIVAQGMRVWSTQTTNVYLQLNPKALMSKMSGFFFSSYGVTAEATSSTVLIGMNTYQHLFDLCVKTVGINATDIGLPTVPPKRKLYVKLRDDVSTNERLDLMNAVKPFIGESVSVTDTIAFLELTRSTVNLLMAFFYVVAIVASLLCFFMLFTTFEANVRDNLWEFGVLRALGISSRQLLRIFVYEAMGMIIAAIALGTVIGLAIAITLTLQQNLFTEMPFKLIFPGWLFAGVIITSIFVAGLGASMPVRAMLPRPIAQVLKGK